MLKLKTTKKEISGRENYLVNFRTQSRYAESYRSLRTHLFFSMMEKELCSLVVTSTLPGEGKSVTVANLAYSLALAGKSVLMVDADLRKHGLSTSFGVENAIGFSNITDILGRHVDSGKISHYGLKDLVKLNVLQQRDCVLNLLDGRNEIEFHFLKGELVDIHWQNRPDEQKLAGSLIRQKLLNEEEAKLALDHQRKSGRRVGSMLLNMGLVVENDLKKILSVRVMEAFRVAMRMKDSDFAIRQMSEDEVQSLTNHATINFSKLEKFFPDDTQSFIKKNIDSNILATEEKNLYLLPSGNIPPNPCELLGSVRTEYLLKTLQTKFDVVIVDSSPIISASDALLLAPHVDGVIVVVKVGATPRLLVKDSLQQLGKTKANILGVLLNQADLKKAPYNRYYSYDAN